MSSLDTQTTANMTSNVTDSEISGAERETKECANIPAAKDMDNTSTENVDKWENINNRFPYYYHNKDTVEIVADFIAQPTDTEFIHTIDNQNSIQSSNDTFSRWCRSTEKPDVISPSISERYAAVGGFSVFGLGELGGLYALYCGYDRKQEMTLRAAMIELHNIQGQYLGRIKNGTVTEEEEGRNNRFCFLAAEICKSYLEKTMLIKHNNFCLNGVFIKPKYFEHLTLK